MGTEDIVWGPHFVTDAERNALAAAKAELEAKKAEAPKPGHPLPEPEDKKLALDPKLGKKI